MDRKQELCAATNMLVNRYGSDAWFHAAQRADELSAQGDVAQHETCVAILRRIERITDPAEGALN